MQSQTFRFYLSDNDVFEKEKDVLLGELIIENLSSNGNKREVLRFPLPQSAKTGAQKLLVLRGDNVKPFNIKTIDIQ